MHRTELAFDFTRRMGERETVYVLKAMVAGTFMGEWNNYTSMFILVSWATWRAVWQMTLEIGLV